MKHRPPKSWLRMLTCIMKMTEDVLLWTLGMLKASSLTTILRQPSTASDRRTNMGNITSITSGLFSSKVSLLQISRYILLIYVFAYVCTCMSEWRYRACVRQTAPQLSSCLHVPCSLFSQIVFQRTLKCYVLLNILQCYVAPYQLKIKNDCAYVVTENKYWCLSRR